MSKAGSGRKIAMMRGLLPGILALAAMTASFAAEPAEPPNEVGLLLGATLPDRDLVGDSTGFGPWGAAVGVRGAHAFGDLFNWFGDGTTSWHGENRLAPGNVELTELRTGVEVFVARTGRARWFAAGAVGWSFVDYEANALDFDRPLVSLGFGWRWLTDHSGFVRFETRVDRPLQNEGLAGADIANVQVLFGWGIPFGGPPPDADQDGVRDRGDRCPDTPRGATVDADGCPTDADGDGVYEGLDRCPGTPRGIKVDRSGCPLDADGDGVFDGPDRCPDTPRGATVDAAGCPADADGDGVFDGLDRCPDTPRGAKVDGAGCPIDSDGDGVPDGLDPCPDTPRGTPVEPTGCPKLPAKVESPYIPAEQHPVVLQGVHFETDSARLAANAEEILERVAAGLKDNPGVRVEVAGHTDSSGGERHNQELSKRRAEAVRDYLVRAGVPASQIEARGYGESQPVADNQTSQGRARNRRVELRRL